MVLLWQKYDLGNLRKIVVKKKELFAAWILTVS
jgi:hypothetical protein